MAEDSSTSTPPPSAQLQETTTTPTSSPQPVPQSGIALAESSKAKGLGFPHPDTMPNPASGQHMVKKRHYSAVDLSPPSNTSSTNDRTVKAAKKDHGASAAVGSQQGFLGRMVGFMWTPAPPTPAILKTIVLDNAGDLNLLIRDHDALNHYINVLASSSSLRIASPVWHQELENPKKPKEMKFEDQNDGADALLFVLRVAHMKWTELPNQLNFDEIVRLAVVCAKYDTVASVKPFIRNRIKHLTKEPKAWDLDTFGLPYRWYLAPGNEEWAYVAWTFGLQSDFATLVKNLIRTSRTDAQGNLLNRKGQKMDGRFPPGMLDFVLQARAECVSRLLDTTYAFYKRLRSAQNQFGEEESDEDQYDQAQEQAAEDEKLDGVPDEQTHESDDEVAVEEADEGAPEPIDEEEEEDAEEDEEDEDATEEAAAQAEDRAAMLRILDISSGRFGGALTKLGLPMERPEVGAVGHSIENLAYMLKTMKFYDHTYEETTGDPATIHKHIFWLHIIETALDGLPTTVPEEFINHMAVQAAKGGPV